MYLLDTDVISESRKGERADAGVRRFFADAGRAGTGVYLSVITIGELRRGVERIRYRGDVMQADLLNRWLDGILIDYGDCLLGIDAEIAQVWGRLRVPQGENALDKLIAATALCYQLTVVSGNARHFAPTGVAIMDPFQR